MNIDNKKLNLLGDAFRGIWQVREPTAKARRAIETGKDFREFKISWYVTFKYNGDFMETESKSSINEALDYAIKYLRLGYGKQYS